MKTIKKLILIPALFCFLMLGMISCSSGGGESTPATPIINTLKQGNWRVTSYMDSGTDETSHFTGYNFTFGIPNSITATNGTNTHPGNWSITVNSSNDFDLNIGFTAITTPADFAELTEDWHIISYSSATISLEHVSGGGGGTDTLVFTKN